MAAALGLAVIGATALPSRLHAQQDSARKRSGPVLPVDSVDLDRYVGRWYEVARFPNSFQKDCTAETVAEYERLTNGQIRVVNTCRQQDGTVKRAEGRARLANRQGPTSKLKVRFAPAFLSFLPMVWGNYWILDLTEDYSAALVGDPGREYLWILSRTPVMPDTTYRRMVETAARQGFDIRRLRRSPVAADSMPAAVPPRE